MPRKPQAPAVKWITTAQKQFLYDSSAFLKQGTTKKQQLKIYLAIQGAWDHWWPIKPKPGETLACFRKRAIMMETDITKIVRFASTARVLMVCYLPYKTALALSEDQWEVEMVPYRKEHQEKNEIIRNGAPKIKDPCRRTLSGRELMSAARLWLKRKEALKQAPGPLRNVPKPLDGSGCILRSRSKAKRA